VNNEVSSDYYDIVERVGAGYIMNTVDIGQDLTFIGGVRVETEKNDYLSKYAPNPLTGFPTPAGLIKDTSAVHRETIWLPSLHLTWRAFDFLNIRLAAYRGLARPDFNLRLERYIARNSGAQFGPNVVSLWVGNPNLRAAKAWNYEVNTSFFNNTVGLISLSAFYKDITDMNHMLNGVQTSGRRLLDSLGITWKAPFADGVLYALSYPYNSSRPTHVWGFEAEWQANLGFLPGLLQNIVLSANASIVRSETYVISSSIVMDTVIVPGFPFPVLNPRTVITEVKQRMEGQPETFGNVAIGYDIGGFSARLSVYYQGEFNNLFSADQRNDLVTNSFSRWDFIVRQRLTNNISLMFTVNNFTNVEEGNYIANRITGWNLLDTSQKYGLAAEMGARIEF
jgi:TonB-dependent receptor